MKPFARRKRRVFFFVVSNIFHQPFGIAPEGLFFFRRAVWSGGFFHFTFPWPGGCGSSTKTQKRSQIWPTEIRIRAAAKPLIPELSTTPNALARVRVRVACHTGILIISHYSVIPRACAHAREENGKPSEVLAQWRPKKFGGDFDPVRVAVDEAVSMFSSRQPEDDRRIWLKIANEIGYEAFRDLYLEQ